MLTGTTANDRRDARSLNDTHITSTLIGCQISVTKGKCTIRGMPPPPPQSACKSSNAFPTLTHNFITDDLHFMELPENIILVVLYALQAPFHFRVRKGVVREVLFGPIAGMGQGGRFPPVVFYFYVSFVLFRFDCIVNVEAYMYAVQHMSASASTQWENGLAQQDGHTAAGPDYDPTRPDDIAVCGRPTPTLAQKWILWGDHRTF